LTNPCGPFTIVANLQPIPSGPERFYMPRLKHFSRILLLLLITSATGFTAQPSQDQARPNIVFIFSDDHASQAIGAYGSRINQTPHIDRLAREGLLFENSFCANSICGPSRACILTGKHSHLNGFLRNGDRFDGTQTTFPPLLQNAGYQTALVGKWHLGTTPVGFHHWEVLPGQGNYYNPDFIQMDGTRKQFTGYCTDIITDKALAWLKNQRDSNKPFLLMCQHKAPHRNWAPAKRHFDLFDQDVPEPATLFDDYAGRSPLLKENTMSIRDHFHWGHDMKFHGQNQFPQFFADKYPNREYDRMTPAQQAAWDAHYEPENRAFIEKMRAGKLTPQQIIRWKYQRYIKDYLRCIAAVDEGVGKILDYLDQTGLAENTLVIYCSDQGFYLGEHGWYDKRWIFEESLKMPLLIRWPGVIPAGTRSQALVQNIDYASTFLDIAGVQPPAEMQGRSLAPLLASPEKTATPWRDAIYYAYYESAATHNVPLHYGIRTQRHKLFFLPRTGEWQLFDIQSDPHELRSVHAEPAYATILNGLQKRYRDLQDFYNVNTAVIPATRGDEAFWKKRSAKMNQRIAQGNVELVFIGDSITHGWEGNGQKIWADRYAPRHAVNLGIGGDRTEHVIWRLQHGQLDNVTPQVAVVMIGTNNTGHFQQNPRQVAAGIERIIEIIHEKTPDTKILLLGIFPRGTKSLDPLRLNNTAINQRIRQLGNDQTVFYRDIGNVFLEQDGNLSAKIMPDALHLSTAGYQRWAAALEPLLRQLASL